MKKQSAVSIIFVFASLLWICATAAAQISIPKAASTSPPPAAQPETPQDPLGRTTPRRSVLSFLAAARAGDDDDAALYLNTPLKGKRAAELAHQLFVVIDRRLPARLAQLNDKPEGASELMSKPGQNLVGTIRSPGGDVDIVVERVDRGEAGKLWLFTGNSLTHIPRLFEENANPAIETILPKYLVETRIAGIPLFQWLALLVGLPLLYLFTHLLNYISGALVGYVRRRVQKGHALPRPTVLPAPVRLLLVGFMIRWIMSHVALPILGREFWSSASASIAIVAIVWILILLNGVISIFSQRRLAGEGESTASLLRIVRRAIDGLFILIGVLAALRFFGVDLTAAIAGLGVGGIAIALAAQKTLENMIGGISVVADRAVRIGEMIKVGDQQGEVEHVGLRSTRIRTLGRTLVTIPNGQLANVNLENISLRDKFWFTHVLTLRQDCSPSALREILENVESLLARHPRVETDSLRVRLIRFGSSSLDIELFAYIVARDFPHFLELQQDLLLNIMDTVHAAGTSFAFPTQTLHVANSASLVAAAPSAQLQKSLESTPVSPS